MSALSPSVRPLRVRPGPALELFTELWDCPRFAHALATQDAKYLGELVLQARSDVLGRAVARELAPRLFAVSCSQCGRDFQRALPTGYSHCDGHA